MFWRPDVDDSIAANCVLFSWIWALRCPSVPNGGAVNASGLGSTFATNNSPAPATQDGAFWPDALPDRIEYDREGDHDQH
jgi:hypothetical protein